MDNRSSIYEHRPASTLPNICQEWRIARRRDSFVSRGRCRSLRRNDPLSPTRCPRVVKGHSVKLLSDCDPERINSRLILLCFYFAYFNFFITLILLCLLCYSSFPFRKHNHKFVYLYMYIYFTREVMGI